VEDYSRCPTCAFSRETVDGDSATINRDSEVEQRQRGPCLLGLSSLRHSRDCCTPSRRENRAEQRRCRTCRDSEHFREAIVFCLSRRCSNKVEEPLAYRKIESDQECGADRGGATIATGSRDRPLHPINQAALDVSTNEGVQPELAAEVVVDRASGHIRRRRQLPDGHLVEYARAELPNGSERQPSLWGG